MSDSSSAVVENVTDESNDLVVAHEDYLELVSMRQSVLELKAQKADVLEFLNQAQMIVAQAQQVAPQLQGAQERVQMLNEALQENTNALQDRMKEIVAPYNITGEFTISDTEPHYIIQND